MAGRATVNAATAISSTSTSGSKTDRGSSDAQAAPAAAPTSATAAIGSAVRRSGRTRRWYVRADAVVPHTEESLLVARTVAGAAPGSQISSAGSCTSPPPPDTASTQPAKPAARHSSSTSCSSGTAGIPSAPGVDDGQQVAEAVDHGVRVSLDMTLLRLGDLAVRHQHGAHADLLGPVDVVVRAVAHEDGARRVGDADRVERRPERLGVRLGPRDLAGVDRAVDQLQHAVA